MTSDAGRAEQPQPSCQVWLAPLGAWKPGYAQWLGHADRARLEMLDRDVDRRRSGLAAALVRRLVGLGMGLAPEAVSLERTCLTCGQPHGPPRLPGTRWHCSVAHSGDWVAVAATAVGPVGVDIEAERAGAGDWGSDVHPEFAGRAVQDPIARQLWTRKEAVLKATGEGLRTDLADLVVSIPPQPPQLMSHASRPGLVAQMHDLEVPGTMLVGALAVLTTNPTRLSVRVIQASYDASQRNEGH